jgi:hypothetical protein
LEQSEHSPALPASVVIEVQAFLRCGIRQQMGLQTSAPAVDPTPPPPPFDVTGFEPDPPYRRFDAS